jgi:CheY-like chemotaxis protein
VSKKNYTVHLLGFRSSERMVLQSFFSKLERQHNISFEVLSIVNKGSQIDAALVNMDDIQHNPEISNALTAYGSDTPCVLVYNRKQQQHPEHQHAEHNIIFRPMNFSQVVETIYQSIQEKQSQQRQRVQADFSVLVVDDSPAIRADLRHKLEAANVCVATANDADQALQMYQQHDYDLIFMDVLMPGDKDGYDACLEIKTKRPDLPVVLLTSRDSILSKVRGRMAKCDQYIIKPASKPQVEEVLVNHLFSKPTANNDDLLNIDQLATSRA